MDIFISNLPDNANHVELRAFLRDKLQVLGILAFEVVKKVDWNYAFLTVATEEKGRLFLQLYGCLGGRLPLTQLDFRGKWLKPRRSNKPGQPEPWQIKTLNDKERLMKAKLKKELPVVPKPDRYTLSFQTLMTGIWDYDRSNKLVFDRKLKDPRNGYVTFGKAALVLYLRPRLGIHESFDWHGRIDIPYGAVEHVIPLIDNGQQGTLTFTLKSPPKFYKVKSTNDLHLYAGEETLLGDNMPDISSIQLGRKKKTQRLERLCAWNPTATMNSALCMVFRVSFFDLNATEHAFNFVKDLAVPKEHCWKTMVPRERTATIEAEYAQFQMNLSRLSSFDFAIRFQLTALVLEGTISPMKMTELIPDVHSLAQAHGAELTSLGVRLLKQQIPTPGPHEAATNFSLQRICGLLIENIEHAQKQGLAAQELNGKRKKSRHLALTYKATITPTGMLLQGPEYVVSNRVLRKYSKHAECFMRVFFADEDGLTVFHDPRAAQEEVYLRFLKVLKAGIQVAGEKFEFLGFSHSSLRNHQAWFLRPFEDDGVIVRAKDIIEALGDFSHIHCSAKCAARIGQAFSDTIYSVRIPQTAYVTETDTDVERNTRCFSDGCGTISLALLEKVWKALPPDRRILEPTTLQIRFRGAKGVVSLDPTLFGEQLRIRKSMCKYIARETWRDLELCGANYLPLMVFLNHQFIKILEDLGVPKKCFLDVQTEAVDDLKRITEHPINAASFLENSHSGVFAKIPRLFQLMHQIGLSFHADRFLTDIVEVAAMANLRSLKYRARIPIARGLLLYGIMDETNTLREGEVYIPTRAYNSWGKLEHKVLTADRVVVARAPAYHPGDIQLVTAVNVTDDSPLRSLYNCIVFSQQGARDLPSQLSGGDLDGDLFHIIYDKRLIPDFAAKPAEYSSTPAEDLGRPVEVDDIAEFFVQHMRMDLLGQIATKHKIRADVKPTGTYHPECILLCQLASDAVDFSKSGIPADLRKLPPGKDHIRPDFMASGPNLVVGQLGSAELEELQQEDPDEPDSISILDSDRIIFRYYQSDKVLGILYRNIDEKKFFDKMKRDYESFRHSWGGESLMQKLERYIDYETRGFQWKHHRDFAEELREYYEDNMFEIMDTLRPHRGKPLTELEVFSGNILGKKERASNRYLNEANQEVQERFDRDVSDIIRRILTDDAEWDGGHDAEALPRAIACFKVALETDGWENYRSLKSWKYVTAAVCLEQLWKHHGGSLRPPRV